MISFFNKVIPKLIIQIIIIIGVGEGGRGRAEILFKNVIGVSLPV